MALQKLYKTSYGIDADYHMISNIQIIKLAQIASITVSTYINYSIRRQSLTDTTIMPIITRTFNVPPDKFNQYFSVQLIENNQYQQAYSFLKENIVDFQDSIDLLDDNVLPYEGIIEPMKNFDEESNYDEEVYPEEIIDDSLL